MYIQDIWFISQACQWCWYIWIC